ncbi:MAG: polysaccharide deacetylase family protein, partial [Lachnospiraceae bacterium]|nr:polysaccharide deacetylase family protein [Lachnospiraceae bacterium]
WMVFMRLDKSYIGKIFLFLLAISVMLGLCVRLAVGMADSTQTETLPNGSLLSEEGDWDMEDQVIQVENRLSSGIGDTGENKMVALTFDDGPNVLYTERLLDGLAERDVKVTFFLIGKNAEAHPEIVRRIAEEGHLIGNHTYSHLKLTAGNEAEFLEEINRTGEIISDITGSTPVFCRPPFGVWNTRYEERLGIIPVLWDVDPRDWCTFDTQTVANRILSDCHDSAIILMHDEYETSVEAALLVIDELKQQGYTFVTVDKLLIDP